MENDRENDRTRIPNGTVARRNEVAESPTILRFHEEREFETEERCAIIEILNHEGDEECSIARARVRPGVTTALHSVSGTVERYVILEGRGAVEIAGAAPVDVGPLDVVRIPAGVTQRIRNSGSGDLVFLCVCTPRFRPDAYVHLEREDGR